MFILEKQKKWSFNIIDVLFALAVLALIGFLVFRIAGLSFDGAGGNSREYYIITFSSDAVADYVLDHVRVGAPVTDDKMTRDFGTVVDIQTAPSVYYNVDNLGNTVESSRDDTRSLRLICRAKGAGSGADFTVDGSVLGIGDSLVIRAEEAKMFLTVYDVQKLTDTSYPLPDSDG